MLYEALGTSAPQWNMASAASAAFADTKMRGLFTTCMWLGPRVSATNSSPRRVSQRFPLAFLTAYGLVVLVLVVLAGLLSE